MTGPSKFTKAIFGEYSAADPALPATRVQHQQLAKMVSRNQRGQHRITAVTCTKKQL